MPDEYYQPHTELCKIRDLMWFNWWQLDDRHNRKFGLWFQKVDDDPMSKFFNVNYAVREKKKTQHRMTNFNLEFYRREEKDE